MKGVELPINILVIVAVAVIVLLGLVALYFAGWSPWGGVVTYQSVKNTACDDLIRFGCGSTSAVPITNFDADQDTFFGPDDTGTAAWDWANSACGGDVNANSDNLAALCACSYGQASEGGCRQLCGCPSTGQ